MSFLNKLFGGGTPATPKEPDGGAPVAYKGFSIRATPFVADGQYQCCGVITREIDGETKEHRFIRADKFSSLDDAIQIIQRKGQQMIDQMGDRIFS